MDPFDVNEKKDPEPDDEPPEPPDWPDWPPEDPPEDPDWPPEDEWPDGPSSGDEGTDNGDDGCEGVNPFTLKGNATRKVTDLSMTGREPLHWIRYNNSIPRLLVLAFGQGAAWRHNWQYELQVWRDAEGEHFLFIYPSGIRRSFHRQADGSLATRQERYKEKARIIDDCVEITTVGEKTLVFKPVSSPASLASAGVYQLVTLTGKTGRVIHFDHDSNGLLRYISNEAGNQITLYYRNVGIPCISRVETSDGRAVEYDYESMTSPLTGQEYVTLARVYYGDGTNAEYKYDFVSSGRAPLLVEADDPRYGGRAKHIGYRYHAMSAHGVIHEEFNPVTGKAYVTLEFDPADPERRIVHYTDDRSITYRVPEATNGRPTERIDSLGRKRTWSYSNEGTGWLEEKTSAGGVNVKYTRNKKGKITRVTSSDGLEVDIERDQSGKIAKTKDNRGRIVEYARDSKGRVLQSSKTTVAINKPSHSKKGGARQSDVNTPAGKSRKESIKRDASGHPVRRDYSDGTYEEFKRDKKGNVVTQRDRKGGLHRYTHAERGLVASETDPAGQTTRYSYDLYGQRTSQTDALGRVTTWERDERGLVTRLVNPDGSVRVYSYDKYGRKTGETDEIGRAASWQYDNLTRLTGHTDFDGGVTRYDYAETPGGCGTCSLISNPSRIIRPDGRVDEFLYDTEGHLLMRSVAVGTAHLAVTLYAYDDADNLIQQTNPDGGVIKHTYDIEKRRLSTTDSLGRTTSWTYDAEGNRLSQTDASGRVTDYVYDADNNLIYTVTADGAETTHEYDSFKHRIRTTDALGNTTRWNYDDVGNLVSVIDAVGGETRHTYDNANRRISTRFPDGTSQTWTYTAAGQISQTITSDGLKMETGYDAAGRVIAMTSAPVGTSQATPAPSASITRATYDAAGRRMTATDALNRITRHEYNARNQVTATIYPDGTQTRKEYDAAGRVIADTDQLGHVTRYTYTPLGDMATLTDANGNTYFFEYDKMRRKTAMIYPDNSQETWTYDLGGRLATHTTRAGQTKTIAYNTDHKPVSEIWSPAGCAPDIVNTYDATGRLASTNNGNALLTYTYDKLGRITSETNDIRALIPGMLSHTVGYLYDKTGRKAGLLYPDGLKVSYRYDAQGRMTEVYNGNRKPLAVYDYDAYGRRARLTRDNDVVTNYIYDAASQVLAIDHVNNENQLLAKAHYEYDIRGRRVSMAREDDFADHYRYDATSQLVGVDYGEGRTETFTYDPLGNRIEHTDATPTLGQPVLVERYETNNLNQYTRVGPAPLTYDANGNLTDDGTQRYRYDAQNRLVEVESATVKAEFAYDARNRCILRRYYKLGDSGGWILNEAESLVLTYDESWNLLVDRSVAGKGISEYIYGNRGDEILASKRNFQLCYTLADALGSVIALDGMNDKEMLGNRYDAFGKLNSSLPVQHRLLFTGREYIKPIDINDHRNRYYSFKLGRWLASDPIKFNGEDSDLYRYVHN
ncbi:RHS repeat-associated core domain-containing protein, partial [Termitidicoccus mucosus]